MKNSRYVIGIGAQKAGTTWLADYLTGHPEVFVSPIKELHFFDSLYCNDLEGFEKKRIATFVRISNKLRIHDILKNTARYKRFSKLSDAINMRGDIQRYRQYFADKAKDKSVYCEITPTYALLNSDGFEAINNLADDVRLIFLLRNPVDRFWSAVRMATKKNNNEDIYVDFTKYFREPYISRTDYGKTLSTVYKIFPKERVYVQFYEHLFRETTIADLCHFCDITFLAADTQKRVLEGKAVPLPNEIRKVIFDKLQYIYDWAEEEFNGALPDSWISDIATFR